MSTDVEGEGRISTPLYIEYTTNTADGAITRRIPTTLPIPAETIESLDLDTAVLVVTSAYLASYTTLETFNVRPLRRLKYMGGDGNFEPDLAWTYADAAGFDKLESIEFCGVENVRHIPDNFLLNCSALKSIDLSPFHHVTSVGSFFLRGCQSLTSLDTSPLCSVTKVGESYFLYGCTSLTSIDLNLMRNVTETGDCFMNHCRSLTSIDLTPLSNVTSIGIYFMYECTSLTDVDLTPLVNMKKLPVSFMQGCKAFAPDVRAQFEQSVKDRKAQKKIADAAARKVVVKAGGKKK